MGKQNPELEQFAKLLVQGIKGLFKEQGDATFSKEPILTRKQILEYQGRMRVDGMSKFDNQPTYVAAVNYYATAAEMQKNKALGTLVVYVRQEYIPKMMRVLQYPPIDDEDEKAMLDSCGTLGNIIAGRFKSEVSAAGYIELEMSAFHTFRNNAPTGLEFCFSEYELYEAAFDLENQKRLVVDMSIGVVPKRH